MQTALRGTGVKSFLPPVASLRQATLGCAMVPRGGSHRSVHVFPAFDMSPFDQYVIFSEVTADVAADTVVARASATTSIATATARMRLKVPARLA